MAKAKRATKGGAKSRRSSVYTRRSAGLVARHPPIVQVARTPSGAEPAPHRYVDPAGRAYISLLGLSSARTQEIVKTVRKGLPFGMFERFVANTSMSSADAAMLVSIPVRTLTRRKQEGRLHPDESDRLLRASRILGRTIELFEGDLDEAKHWLSRPQRALAGAKPLEVAGTEVGALALERLIDQLEQGVFV